MFDDLLNYVFRAADVRPTFTKSRCLAVRQSPAACRRCAEVCPHDAVTVRSRGVEIDDVDCSGCGLCLQACPSEALTSNVRLPSTGSVKCSQVEGNAQTVHCLGRLRPSDLHRLVRGHDEVTLARAECADCPIGNAAVAEAIDGVVADAQELLALRGVERTIRVEVTDRQDDTGTQERMDRRSLLQGGWRNVARSAADALAPLDPGGEEDDLPEEPARRWRALELSDLVPETHVPWPVPDVDETCILCPVCTRVCPTDAFSRTFDANGGGALVLDPAACIGCDACVSACPVDAIRMDRTPPWSKASSGPREVYRRDPDDAPEGGVARTS
ncbi:MAG: 4Fe-4S binding protein [Trueperaceae bacterium]|nr:4Fe-4S binding protein [Trueperaceae bacterium]